MLRSETRIHTQTRLRAYMDRIIKTEGHFIDCTFLTVSPTTAITNFTAKSERHFTVYTDIITVVL